LTEGAEKKEANCRKKSSVQRAFKAVDQKKRKGVKPLATLRTDAAEEKREGEKREKRRSNKRRKTKMTSKKSTLKKRSWSNVSTPFINTTAPTADLHSPRMKKRKKDEEEVKVFCASEISKRTREIAKATTFETGKRGSARPQVQ